MVVIQTSDSGIQPSAKPAAGNFNLSGSFLYHLIARNKHLSIITRKVSLMQFDFLNSLNLLMTLYAVPFGLGSAVSTRVSNELGARKPEAARSSVITATLLVVCAVMIADTALFFSRCVLGYVFSSDKELVDYVTTIALPICIYVFMDGIQGTLSGVVRGCEWQHLGAYVNISAYYLFGIPIALALGFVVNLRARGLWIGILCGVSLQSLLLHSLLSSQTWKIGYKSKRGCFMKNATPM